MFVLSIVTENDTVKVSLVKKNKNLFEILQTNSYSKSVFVDGGYQELKQELELKFKNFLTSSSISTEHVLIREIDLPVTDRKAIYKTLPFQIEQHLPFSIQEGIIHPFIQKEKRATHVLAFCIHQDSYDHHLKEINQLGVDPHFVSCNPAALCRFSNYLFPNTNTIVIYMGETQTEVVSVCEKKPSFAMSIPIGKQQFIAAFKKDRAELSSDEGESFVDQLDLSRLEETKELHVNEVAETLYKHLDRCLYFLIHKKGQRTLENILYTGQTHLLSQFHERIEKSLDLPFKRLEVAEPKKGLLPFAMSIGVALDPLYEDEMSVQFRALDKTQKELNVTLLKKIFFSAVSVFLLSLGIAFSSHLFLSKKESFLDQKLSMFIETNLEEDSTFDTQKIKNLEFIPKLRKVKKHFAKSKKLYGYYLSPVSVSKIISQLTEIKEEKNLSVNLKSLDYELVEYPTLEDPFKEYKTKISLRMEAASLEIAKNFFDELSHQFAIQKDSIKFTENAGDYETTFFLTSSS